MNYNDILQTLVVRHGVILNMSQYIRLFKMISHILLPSVPREAPVSHLTNLLFSLFT